MRWLAALAAASLVACASSRRAPPGASAPNGATPGCPAVYLFDFKIITADGQLTSSGATVVAAASCTGVKVVDAPPVAQTYRVQADAASRQTTLDVSISGQRVQNRMPLEDGVRAVVAEVAWPDRSATLLLMVTAFATDDEMRRAVKARLAQLHHEPPAATP